MEQILEIISIYPVRVIRSQFDPGYYLIWLLKNYGYSLKYFKFFNILNYG